MTGTGRQRGAILPDMREAAQRAGRLLMQRQAQTLQVRSKGPNDLVTSVDREAEELIVAFLQQRWPGVGVLAEESGARAAAAPRQHESDAGKQVAMSCDRFIIDPLDGTTNYVHGYPCFAVSIGLQSGGEIVAGVVHDPVRGEMFTAEKGRGAQRNERTVSVSGVATLGEALLVTGFPFRRIHELETYLKGFGRLLRQAQGVRRDGSAALDLCAVACGRLDGFWENGLAAWDVAAGGLIVAEAGGLVTDYSGGGKWLEGEAIIAATPAIHGAILESLASA